MVATDWTSAVKLRADFDAMLTATAQRRRLHLATRNVKDVRALSGSAFRSHGQMIRAPFRSSCEKHGAPILINPLALAAAQAYRAAG